MKLANIAIGSVGSGKYHPIYSYDVTDQNLLEINGVQAYRDTDHDIYINDDPSQTVSTDDYPVSYFGGLKGIFRGTTCLTPQANTIKKNYTKTTDIININQSGYVGRAFNNQVLSTKGKNVWGFECVFKATSLLSSPSLIEYGYNPNVSSNNKHEMSWYKIYISSAGRIRYARKWHSASQWNVNTSTKELAPDAEITYSGCPSIVAGNWYHFCIMRIGDGVAAHGDGTSEYSLATLKFLTSSTSELANKIRQEYWYLPNVSYSSNSWNYGNALNATNGLTQVNTKLYGYGRFNTSQEECTISTDVHKLNGNGQISFADRVVLKGGYYTQQTMNWYVGSNPTFTTTYTGTTFTNSTLNVVGTAQMPESDGTSDYDYYTYPLIV